MFPILNLKGMAIAGAAVAVISFGTGVWVRDAFCDAAKYKAEVQSYKRAINDLQETIKKRDEAARADAERHAQDQATITELEGRIRNAEKRIGDSECLSSADTNRLRQLWAD